MDIYRLGVLADRLDCLGGWVKEEDLVVVGSIVGLDYQVSSSSDGQNPLHWHSRSNDESSTKVNLVRCVEACTFLVFSSVNVGDRPLLTELVSELTNTNVLALGILTIDDFNDSVVLDVLEVVLGEFKLLEPVTIGAVHL